MLTLMVPTGRTAVLPTRARRVPLLDRPWDGHWSTVTFGPVEAPSVDAIRDVFRRIMIEHPGLAIAGRMDLAGRRWLPVPAADREQHLREIVVAGVDLDLNDASGQLERYRPGPDYDKPLLVVLGLHSVTVSLCHQAGDAATFSYFALKIALADYDGLVALERQARFTDALQILIREARTNWRNWVRRVLSRGSIPDGPRPGAPVATRAGSVAVPAGADVVLTNAQLRALTRWRNEHCRGVAITSVLTAAVHRSLVDQGVPMNAAGFYSLFDLRRYLPKDKQSLFGNLAKSVYLDAPMTDPAAISSAMDQVIDTGRAIPGVVAGALSNVLRPVRRGAEAGVSGPITMSFSSMPTLPGLADLPWIGSARRRYVGYGYPTGALGISVFAVRLRDRMEITASFDASVIDPAAVRRALEALTDIPSLFAPTASTFLVAPAAVAA